MALELLNKADELWEDKEYIFALCKLCLSNAWAEINSDLALSAAEEAIDYCQTQLDVNASISERCWRVPSLPNRRYSQGEDAIMKLIPSVPQL